MMSEAQLLNDAVKLNEAQDMQRREFKAIESMDSTIVVSSAELEIIKPQLPNAHFETLPLLLDVPGTQKKYMDRSDFVLGKTAWFVRKHNPIQVKKFFSFKQLSPIHPHTRVTSDEKQDARAIDARQALPLFEKHGMRMSEAMTDTDPALSSFQSTTRIQVVDMGAGQYVTIEGNGRIEALKRAFKDMPPEFDLHVEVRLQVFEDEKTVNAIRIHVRDCRIAKGLENGA